MRRFALLLLMLSGPSTFAQNLPSHPSPAGPAAADPTLPMHIGGAVLAPKLIFQADPEIPEEARKRHKSIHLQVYTWIGPDGIPSHLRLMQSANLGADTDQRILDAVSQYRYKPATLNGSPVTVDMYIDINMDIF